mgnify:CR=1 FL=1
MRSRGSRESSGGGRERRCHEIQAVRMLDAPAARASGSASPPDWDAVDGWAAAKAMIVAGVA